MKAKRKGSKQVDIGEESFSFFVGKTVTEIRNLNTNKAQNVKNEELMDGRPYCDICGFDPECPRATPSSAITPAAVKNYIKQHIITRA